MRRWEITVIAESLHWFPGFCTPRKTTASKSGSHCGMSTKDRKREKAENQREASLLTYMGGFFGSFYQIDGEESNLMFIG